ncbi:hypothetical protein CLV46_2426 [Diaminobutyricimonas aerilata]|uniref:Uncharacterized protein n=1 Tax=Diaminobutyricimonas aerilata TaxID=1162967 RepID=A0A2M9CLS9_9MICO|nr:hypothetical protein [Diaminobutyricimonas aerilata]PJJ72849.1 hypothetical protein CLV46_2426 [Diaminobutyricimonas aerilata]
MTIGVIHTEDEQSGGARRVRAGWSLAAAALLLGSGTLQVLASLERWVVYRESWTRQDISVEDHLFDYYIVADPWESLGITAALFGVGLLLLAGGVLAAARATAQNRLDGMLATVVAVAFGIDGAHALISAALDAPSVLQYPIQMWIPALVEVGGLVALAARSWRVSRATSLAYVLLLGGTLPGYLFAMFLIAPTIAGYQSHDTTPWTETVIAATTVLAGAAMLVAAAASGFPGRGARDA